MVQRSSLLNKKLNAFTIDMAQMWASMIPLRETLSNLLKKLKSEISEAAIKPWSPYDRALSLRRRVP